MAQRLTPRIVPPNPISVAVERKGGPLVAYGLIADISGNGACVWTDGHLEVGGAGERVGEHLVRREVVEVRIDRSASSGEIPSCVMLT